MKLLLTVLMGTALFGAEEVPDWARQAAAQTTPSYPPKVISVVLLQEENVAVDADGRRTMRERGAIKILQKGGDALSAFRAYNTKTGRIRDFRGWLIPASGPVVRFGKDQILDVALSKDYTYDEARAKVLECGAAAPGAVFAYEVIEEEKSVFTQYPYSFQGTSPVLVSRFVLSLPQGWEARGTILNHAAMEPQVAGNAYTWEIRNLPWIEKEIYSPDIHAIVPRLGVAYFPAGENKAGLKSLKDWAAVSAWLSEFADPPSDVTTAVREKAAELTAGAKTELDKIRAIATFAQKVNYVSVQMNITRGGGYTPHRADDVLARNYGDCKDKSTLMRALLKAAGISSYMTVIYSSDREFVRPEWPSPMQFNHAIVAVRVSPETRLPTVLEHPRLGRLLMFDPTDPTTPTGDLPEDEQGSHALILAGGQGELLEMPLLPASTNRIESSVEASMDAGGKIDVRVTRQYFGQAASSLRDSTTHQSNEELRRSFERGLSRRLGGASVKQISVSPEEASLKLNLNYGADHFSQLVQGLLITKPGALAIGHDYAFPAGERKLAVKLSAHMYKDSVRIKLPPGYKIDEMPPPVHIEERYGAYTANWKSEGADLLFDQALEVHDMVIPASEYKELRAFFDQLGGSQSAPVVLVKQ